jgi:hypothetical protein
LNPAFVICFIELILMFQARSLNLVGTEQLRLPGRPKGSKDKKPRQIKCFGGLLGREPDETPFSCCVDLLPRFQVDSSQVLKSTEYFQSENVQLGLSSVCEHNSSLHLRECSRDWSCFPERDMLVPFSAELDPFRTDWTDWP